MKKKVGYIVNENVSVTISGKLKEKMIHFQYKSNEIGHLKVKNGKYYRLKSKILHDKNKLGPITAPNFRLKQGVICLSGQYPFRGKLLSKAVKCLNRKDIVTLNKYYYDKLMLL